MIADPKTDTTADKPISPELDRHLSDPAEMTEQVSGQQDRAQTRDQSPTEPGVTTEQQPT